MTNLKLESFKCRQWLSFFTKWLIWSCCEITETSFLFLNPQRFQTTEETAHVLPKHSVLRSLVFDAHCSSVHLHSKHIWQGPTFKVRLQGSLYHSSDEPCLTVNNMMSLMIPVSIKHLGGHTNSSITALPISSEMMTVAASLARQSCCWLSSSPLWESENRYQSCPATRTNYCLTVYKYVCAPKCRVNRATFCWIQIRK